MRKNNGYVRSNPPSIKPPGRLFRTGTNTNRATVRGSETKDVDKVMPALTNHLDFMPFSDAILVQNQ